MTTEQKQQYKAGTVLLIGRPNAGKSTLLNNLLKTKVSITSPKPQTTRFPIEAVYEDERGQIIFTDTPGVFGKARDQLARKINQNAHDAYESPCDVVLYVIDKTRSRDYEENKTLGHVRSIKAPKIVVFNKIDVRRPDYTIQYLFLKDEVEEVIEISALRHDNLNLLLDAIFKYLPEREAIVDTTNQAFAAINMTSNQFIAEIIREKVFLFTRKEVPYSITTTVDEVTERANGNLYIKGNILTDSERYKAMLIGDSGKRIKEMGTAVRKELEAATGKKVFVDLNVAVDVHWHERF